MTRIFRFVSLSTSLLLVLSACNLPTNQPAPTPVPDLMATSVALTVAAQSSVVTPLPTPTLPLEPAPTNTLPPPSAPTSVPTATTVPLPCNWGSFVADVTYPDNAEVPAGQSFVKTWRLLNKGSCTWTSGYTLIFDRGDRMGAPDSVVLTSGTVPPGGTVDVSVQLTAPASAGTYQGFFRLKTPEGSIFGINTSTADPFWVKIKVPGSGGSSGGGKPDLIITEMTVTPSNPHKGDEITVRVSAYNSGDVASGPFQVEWRSSSNLNLNPACEWDVPSMVPRGGKVLTCTYTYNSWSTYTIRAEADTNDDVDESNEGNNILEQSLPVGP